MIDLRGIGKRFGERWIFRDVSFHVKPEESLVLMGPSGSGKSVLLKTIAGLLKPDTGIVQLDDENIGMLFQKNALFDSLTVEENLLFPLGEKKKLKHLAAKEIAKKFLKAVGLDGCQNLFPDEISGGMQKRLGIARALVVEPKIILYDEPTAGLDPITSRVIAELILNLRKQVGSTLLTVTNDVRRAYQLGDRISLLARERYIEGGTPEQIIHTDSPEIRQFIFGLQTGPLTGALA